MSQPDLTRRYDVSYSMDRSPIDAHFCREWEGGEGCYGTNSDHGFSWEEAKQEHIKNLQAEITYWTKLTEKDFWGE